MTAKKHSCFKLGICLTVFGILLFGVCMNSMSQSVKLRAGVDSTRILIGDQVKLGFEITQPKGLDVVFPQFMDTIVDKIEIVETFGRDTTWITDQEFMVKQDYLITSFDSGFFIFPPFDFVLKNDFIQDTFQSKPFYIEVFTLPVDTAKGIFDIKPLYQTPVTAREVLPIVLYVLLGLAVAALIIYVVMKRKKKEPIFQRIKPKPPPHLVAFEGLEKLKHEKLWQKGMLKEYYTRLTEIVRMYVEQRFLVRAMEQTTDQTIDAFKEVNSDKELISDLRELLSLADFVKFAKHIPLPEQNDKCFQDAYDFVRKTKPIEELMTQNQEQEPEKQPELQTEEQKQV